MATATRSHRDVLVLERVPFKTYVRLSRAEENQHLRMAYHDGTLEIVSPATQKHEIPSRRLSILVAMVADRLRLRYHGTRSSTYRRSGTGPFSGKGKEPDESFYFANVDRMPRDRDPNLDAGDPPPDLWIEVDHRVSSSARLPIYASLGVPEVWRYRSRRKTLQFLGLVDGLYVPIVMSRALPGLTPSLVIEGLTIGVGLLDSEWTPLLRNWVDRTSPGPPVIS